VSLTILLGAWRLGGTLASRVGTRSRYRVFGSVPKLVPSIRVSTNS